MDSGWIWTLDELGGKVVSYGKSVSSDSPLIPVTFSVPNKGGFIPGSFLQTRIITRSETPAITLPTTSLIEEQGNYFVYRQLTPEYFEKTPVTIGHEVERESTWFSGYHEKFFFDRGVLYEFLYGSLAKPIALQFLLRHQKTMCGEIPIGRAYVLMCEGLKEARKR